MPALTGWSKRNGKVCFLCHTKPFEGFASALFHRNLFDIGLNMWCGYILFYCVQKIIEQSTYFSPVQILWRTSWRKLWVGFCVNPVDDNMQHLLRISGIRQMLLQRCRNTIWCTLSGQGVCVCLGGGGACSPLGSKTGWKVLAGQNIRETERRWYSRRQENFSCAPLPHAVWGGVSIIYIYSTLVM